MSRPDALTDGLQMNLTGVESGVAPVAERDDQPTRAVDPLRTSAARVPSDLATVQRVT